MALPAVPLVIICGPTATNKSEIALKLSQKINGEIIISDSRQIYKYFDIGTAKPTIEEQKITPHHLLDICEPDNTYTVAQYQKDALDAINNIINKVKIPMMVGGTGLYIKAIIDGFKIPKVLPDEKIRKNLKSIVVEQGSLYLYEQLKKVDLKAANKIHPNDVFRIIRALEVYYTTGKPISDLWQKEINTRYKLFYIAINTSKEVLKQRIALRIENMIQNGLIDEVKWLIKKYSYSLPLLYTLNYREICEYLKEKISLEDAKKLMEKNTKKYAKQQLTWFRADERITWWEIIDYTNISCIIDKIYTWLIQHDL